MSTGKKHPVDLHSKIPFLNAYLVLQMGKNKRNKNSQSLSTERRVYNKFLELFIFYLLALGAIVSMLFLLFFVSYCIKSALGIDLIKNFHFLGSYLEKWHVCTGRGS